MWGGRVAHLQDAVKEMNVLDWDEGGANKHRYCQGVSIPIETRLFQHQIAVI